MRVRCLPMAFPAAIRLERRRRRVPSRKAAPKKTTESHAHPKDLHMARMSHQQSGQHKRLRCPRWVTSGRRGHPGPRKPTSSRRCRGQLEGLAWIPPRRKAEARDASAIDHPRDKPERRATTWSRSKVHSSRSAMWPNYFGGLSAFQVSRQYSHLPPTFFDTDKNLPASTTLPALSLTV